jgi:hypothetical protein
VRRANKKQIKKGLRHGAIAFSYRHYVAAARAGLIHMR